MKGAAGIRSVVLCLGVFLLGGDRGAAADWPQWRGPRRDGHAPGVKLPETWPEKLHRVWAVGVGEGHASPVVAGGKVVVFCRLDAEREAVHCLRAEDGRPVWSAACPAPYKPPLFARKHGRGPFATPTIAGGKVYTLGITGTLSCLDLETGKVLWRRTFADEFDTPHPTWGAANSPLLEGGQCILSVGSTRRGSLAAFHADTGKTAWTLEAARPGYGSAVAADLAGRRQVVTLTSAKVVGAAAASGKLLWAIPFKTAHEQNCTTPVVHGDTVFFTGYNLGLRAFRFSADGESITAEKQWESDEVSMYMSSPVLLGGHLYGLAQRRGGTLVCLNAADGRTAWASPGRLGEYASLVVADATLLVLTTEGEMLVVAADPRGYRERARYRLTERPVWAHLAAVPGALFLKDASHLLCLALPEP